MDKDKRQTDRRHCIEDKARKTDRYIEWRMWKNWGIQSGCDVISLEATQRCSRGQTLKHAVNIRFQNQYTDKIYRKWIFYHTKKNNISCWHANKKYLE